MQIATWLFVTSTLVAPAPAPKPATLVMHPPQARPATAPIAAQQRATVAPIGAGSAHRFGLGGSLSVSNYGVAGRTNYWFTKHVGVSMSAGWSRPRAYGYYSPVVGTTVRTTSSTVTASPGVMVNFSETDPNRAVSVRPFAGVGATYAHAARVASSAATLNASYSATSLHEFGGVEMFFRDHRNIAISAEVIHTNLPASFVNRGYVGGTNFLVAATFYLK